MTRLRSILMVVGMLAVAGFSPELRAGGPVQVSNQDSSAQSAAAPLPPRAVLDKYCVTCHNQKLRTGDLALDTVDLTNVGEHAATWEKVVRKLRAGMMPPVGRPRPEKAASDAL